MMRWSDSETAYDPWLRGSRTTRRLIWRKRYGTRKADDSKSKQKRFKILQRNIWHIKMKDYQIYHNYIREHEGLDEKTPTETCGIKIEGKNKWKTLIQNASKK